MNKLLKNEYVFSIISKGLMVFVGLAESALLARYLGPELRGSLAYIYSVSSTIYLLMTMGIYTIYPFLRKNDSRDTLQIMNEFMTIATVLFIVYFFICGVLDLLCIRSQESLFLILLMIPFMGYDKITSFVFMIENPNKTNFITLITNIIQCLFIIVCMCLSSEILLVGVLFYVIGCVIRSVYFIKKLPFKFDIKLFKLEVLWSYVKFGFFPMLALLLTTLNYRLDVIMLKQYSTIAISQIGIYSIGMGLSEKCLLIPDALKEVLLSKLAKGKKEEEVAKVMRVCFWASVMTAIIIQLLGKVVINVLYGEGYNGAENVTYIAVWGTTFMVFFKMISQYNVIQHRQHLNVLFLLISIAANFSINLLLIPRLGINGAAIATVIGYTISSFIFLMSFKKVSGISFSKMIFIQKEDISFLTSFFPRNNKKVF